MRQPDNMVSSETCTWLAPGAYCLFYVSEYLGHCGIPVRIGTTSFDKFDSEEGVPTGGILAVTCFWLKINDLPSRISRDSFKSLFIDNLVICFLGRSLDTRDIYSRQWTPYKNGQQGMVSGLQPISLRLSDIFFTLSHTYLVGVLPDPFELYSVQDLRFVWLKSRQTCVCDLLKANMVSPLTYPPGRTLLFRARLVFRAFLHSSSNIACKWSSLSALPYSIDAAFNLHLVIKIWWRVDKRRGHFELSSVKLWSFWKRWFVHLHFCILYVYTCMYI